MLINIDSSNDLKWSLHTNMWPYLCKKRSTWNFIQKKLWADFTEKHKFGNFASWVIHSQAAKILSNLKQNAKNKNFNQADKRPDRNWKVKGKGEDIQLAANLKIDVARSSDWYRLFQSQELSDLYTSKKPQCWALLTSFGPQESSPWVYYIFGLKFSNYNEQLKLLRKYVSCIIYQSLICALKSISV